MMKKKFIAAGLLLAAASGFGLLDSQTVSAQENVLATEVEQKEPAAIMTEIIFDLVNEERGKYGLSQLEPDAVLEETAMEKSDEMGRLNYFSHVSPNGTLTLDWLKRDGHQYRAWGENIAKFTDFGGPELTAEAIMRGWMNSPGHRANILSPNFTLLGIGITEANDRIYATQVFGDTWN